MRFLASEIMAAFTITPRAVAASGANASMLEDASATERILLAARREATEALRAHMQYLQLTKAPNVAAPHVAAAAAPPSAEDLFTLYALHGGSQAAVIQTLAKLWRCESTSIAPTVRAWLDQLPAYAPPSRTRSSPAALAPHAMQQRLESLGRAALILPQTGVTLKRGVLRYTDHRAAPAASAPIGPSSVSFASVMSGLHSASSRLHADASSSLPHPRFDVSLARQEGERGGRRGGGDARDCREEIVLRLPQREPTFVPVLLTAAEMDAIPEHPTDENHDEEEEHGTGGGRQEDALEAFMTTRRLVPSGRAAKAFVTREALKGRIEPSKELRYDISHSMRF